MASAISVVRRFFGITEIVSRAFLVCASALLVMIQPSIIQAAEAESWRVSERTLPVPKGASERLRTSIAATPQPDVVSGHWAPGSIDEWTALIDQRARQRQQPLETIEKQFSVAISKDTIAGVGIYRIQPDTISSTHEDHLFLYVHGGAYVFGGGDASVFEAAIIASRSGIPTISIDYRMPPADPFPAAVDDLVTVYRAVLKDVPPSAIAFGGTSAGGGLALAGVHRLKSLDLPVPGALYAGTPWADLTKTGDTLYSNEGIDRVLVTYDGTLGAAAVLYANGEDLKNPLLSPVYGEFDAFPATILITGTRDMFLSDTARTHRRLRAAGVTADLHVYEAMSHAGYAFELASPESQDVYREIAAFLARHLQ